MCYSAMIKAEYRKYVRAYGASLSLQEYHELFVRRIADPRLKLPKAVEAMFQQPENDEEREIKVSINQFNAAQALLLEEALFAQRRRLADAERTLKLKPTKAAAQSQRIATDKIEWALGRLDDLRRTEPLDRDARIFPGVYAPVLVMEAGRRVIKPMRYQCRPAGKPAFYDSKYPGTYNARRDSLGGFWKGLFGLSHGILIAEAFYENVDRHRVEGRALAEGESVENMVLEFRPRSPQPLLMACLWSRWSAPGEPELLSFAVITDEPPAEVAAAGHDRCVIPILEKHLEAWLTPHRGLSDYQAILDDRDRPFYEHRLAA